MNSRNSYLDASLFQEKMNLGSWNGNNGLVEKSVDIGNAINGIRLFGDIKVKSGSTETVEELKFAHMERIVVTLNGTAVIDLSGDEFQNWKYTQGFNDPRFFNDREQKTNVDIPFFNNYQETNARYLTVPNTGTGSFIGRLSIKIRFKKTYDILYTPATGAETHKTYTIEGGFVDYQSATTSNIQGNNNNFLQIRSHSKTLTQTGDNEITDLPKDGVLTQYMIVPISANSSASLPNMAVFTRSKIKVNNVDRWVMYNLHQNRTLESSNYRNPPQFQPCIKEGPTERARHPLDEGNFCYYDQTTDGNGLALDGSAVGIRLAGASSFIIQVTVDHFITNGGSSATSAPVNIITTSIIQLSGQG